MKNVSGKRSIFKTAVLTLGILSVLSLAVTAESASQLKLKEAAETILERDLNQPVLSGEPLSIEAQMYNNQSVITDELKKLNEVQNDYNDLQAELGFEQSTYDLLYQYGQLQKALDVTEKSLKLSKEQLRLAEVRYKQGVISEGQLLQVEISVNDAQVAKEELERNVAQLRYQLNQLLGKDLDQSLHIAAEKVEKLERSKRSRASVSRDVKDNHPSLKPLNEAISAFERARDQVDKLDVDPTTLEEYYVLQEAVQKRDAICKDDNDNSSECIGAREAADQAKDEFDQAKARANSELNEVKKELKDYYDKQIRDTRRQLTQQKQRLEMMVHASLDELEQLERAIQYRKDNVTKAERLYRQAEARFETGLSTASQLEEARLALLNAELNLAGTEKDYLAAKKKYELFLEGYLGGPGY